MYEQHSVLAVIVDSVLTFLTVICALSAVICDSPIHYVVAYGSFFKTLRQNVLKVIQK